MTCWRHKDQQWLNISNYIHEVLNNVYEVVPHLNRTRSQQLYWQGFIAGTYMHYFNGNFGNVVQLSDSGLLHRCVTIREDCQHFVNVQEQWAVLWERSNDVFYAFSEDGDSVKFSSVIEDFVSSVSLFGTYTAISVVFVSCHFADTIMCSVSCWWVILSIFWNSIRFEWTISCVWLKWHDNSPAHDTSISAAISLDGITWFSL